MCFEVVNTGSFSYHRTGAGVINDRAGAPSLFVVQLCGRKISTSPRDVVAHGSSSVQILLPTARHGEARRCSNTYTLQNCKRAS